MKQQSTTYNRFRVIILPVLAAALLFALADYLVFHVLLSDTRQHNYALYREMREYATLALGVLVPVALAIPIYYWLRKNQHGKKSEVTTALIVTAGAVISSVATPLVSSTLSSTHFESIGLAVATYLFNAVVAFIFAVLGAHVAKKFYARRHGIVVE